MFCSVRTGAQNLLLGNRLHACHVADRTCGCDGLFDLCYEFCASLFFTFDRSESIMAVFVFYGYWGRARCKVFAFSTYRRQVMAVFVLPFRSKTAPI